MRRKSNRKVFALEPVAAVEKPRPLIGMRAVMDGVRRSVASTDWQRSGLVDPGLMRSIEVIVREIRKATGDPTIGPSVWFGDVPPGLGNNATQALHVAMSPAYFDRSVLYPSPVVLDGGRAARSILIADGDVVLTSAEDCLIVATGAVEVSATRCFIIAGRMIRASGDTSSVLLSGSKLSVSHANGFARGSGRPSIYSAPDQVDVSHASGVVFLNAGYRSVSHQTGCRPLDWPALDFDDANREARPVAWKGRITPVYGSRTYPGGGFDLRLKGVDRPIHVEIGRPILDADGLSVPELAGWIAYRSTSEYAMLSKGRRLLEMPLNARDIAGR